MNAIVFTARGDADSISTAIDTRLGYPKPGVDIGGGVHAPPAQTVTIRYGDVERHPTLALWRYPYDTPVQGEVGRGLAIPVTGAVSALDATWFPAGLAAQQAEAKP